MISREGMIAVLGLAVAAAAVPAASAGDFGFSLSFGRCAPGYYDYYVPPVVYAPPVVCAPPVYVARPYCAPPVVVYDYPYYTYSTRSYACSYPRVYRAYKPYYRGGSRVRVVYRD